MCSLQDSLEEQSSQGSFVAHGRYVVLTTAIGRLEYPRHVCVAGAGVTIKQYSLSMAPRKRRVVLISQGTIKTWVTQRNAGYTSKKILPAWLP